MMKNLGSPQFNFETFKVSYDSDPRVANLVKNFDKENIEFKLSSMDDVNPQTDGDSEVVSQMAKSATDLGGGL